jgi:hypothetical protein
MENALSWQGGLRLLLANSQTKGLQGLAYLRQSPPFERLQLAAVILPCFFGCQLIVWPVLQIGRMCTYKNGACL